MTLAPGGPLRRGSRIEPATAAPGGSLRPAPIPTPGDLLFGRYRLVKRLGIGGTAEVWQARDEQLSRDVAIKLLHRHLVPDEQSRERFAGEAKAVAALSHPGIVAVHDIVVGDDMAAIVLELVEGESISARITEHGPLPPLAAAAIAAQIADALQSAHERGLIHRDVKPGNVLLSADGRARLVDFGIARGLEDTTHVLTMPGTIMGTLRYMSPEQLAGQPATAGSDVYGLGAVLYEMLAGQPPFPATTPANLVADQRNGAPGIPRVDPELAGLAQLALDRNLDRRPRSAGSMAVLLRGWLLRFGGDPNDLPATVAASLSAGPNLALVDPLAVTVEARPSSVLGRLVSRQNAAIGAAAGAAAGAAPVTGRGRRVPLAAAVVALLLVVALVAGGTFLLLRSVERRPTPTPSPVATQPAVVIQPTIAPKPIVTLPPLPTGAAPHQHPTAKPKPTPKTPPGHKPPSPTH
jgi:serine/threonine-protein kinase